MTFVGLFLGFVSLQYFILFPKNKITSYMEDKFILLTALYIYVIFIYVFIFLISQSLHSKIAFQVKAKFIEC